MNYLRRFFALWMILALASACATPTPGDSARLSPLDQTVAKSIVPTATPRPTAEPTATPAPSPTAMPTPTAVSSLPSLKLAVLHTNDNWGETEPCG